MENWKEDICRKLRETSRECGRDALESGAVIIGPEWTETDQVGGVKYLNAPTIAQVTLAGTDWETTRFFEEV